MIMSFFSRRRIVLSLLALACFNFATAFQQPQQGGGISPWVWVLIVILLIVIVAWLLYRQSRQTGMARSTVEPGVRSYEVPADDLTIIEGIGPKIAQILATAGITTFSQLAATDTDRLKQILRNADLQMLDPSTWAEQARLAAAGDQAGLQALQERLKGGRQV